MSEFARKGFEGTSLRELAASAGVDMALVARLFGSKGELWDAVIERLADQQLAHRARLEELTELAGSDPAAGLKDFLIFFAHISFEMPAFPALLLLEAANPGERLDTLTERLVFPFREQCRPIFNAAHGADLISIRRFNLFFTMLISAIAMPMVSLATWSDEERLTEALRDEIAAQAVAMFMKN
jgi:AcrR family transcriptional regulator